MRVNFDAILAAVTMRAAEIKRQSVIERVAIGGQESSELDFSRLQFARRERFTNFESGRTGQPQYANTAGTGRGCDRDDGVFWRHGELAG